MVQLECKKDARQLNHHAKARGWLDPRAFVTSQDYFFVLSSHFAIRYVIMYTTKPARTEIKKDAM